MSTELAFLLLGLLAALCGPASVALNAITARGGAREKQDRR